MQEGEIRCKVLMFSQVRNLVQSERLKRAGASCSAPQMSQEHQVIAIRMTQSADIVGGVVKRDGVSKTTNQHGVTTEQEDTVFLMCMKERFGMDFSVSETIYRKWGILA